MGRMKASVKKTPTRTEYRILVCGSRDWDDIDLINKHLTKAIVESGHRYPDILVITGSTIEANNGADSLVATLCLEELGIACAIFPAPWEAYRRLHGNPRSAGPTRNSWMLRWGRPDLVLAFHPYLPNSRGTKNMCEQARRAGIPVRVIDQ
jgi:hypothetical protein